MAEITFGHALDSWLESKRISLKQSSYVKYHNIICKHVKPSLGGYFPAEITSAALNAFAAERFRSGGRGGLSEKTVRGIMMLTKAALRSAEGGTADIRLSLPREGKKEMRVLTLREQALLEKHLNCGMDACKLGVFVCLYTGLRLGEVCALKWSDISIENGTLTVRRTLQRLQTLDGSLPKTALVFAEPKSNCSARTIPLPECLLGKLARFKPSCPSAYLLTADAEQYVEPRTYQNRFKAYVKGSGISDANFHATRHTFATRCVEAGFEIKSLSEILGHANVNITLDRYVHPSLDMKRSNMNKLNCLS